MQLGTPQEIREQELKVHAAESAVMMAKLRLRALKGEPLIQFGDNCSVFDLQETLVALQNEFGARNLRAL